MRYSRVFRILALAVIFSLLMLAIPAGPALAASIALSPTSGTVGTTVTVTGTAFDAYIGQTVYIFFNYSYVASALVSTGTFTTTFTVPSSYTTAQTIGVAVQLVPTYTQGQPVLATTSFAVVARAITISPATGYVGDTVTVSGSGFTASSTVTIYFDSTSVDTVTTNSSGTFSSATFTVPDSHIGSHTVKGTDTSGDSPTITFTVSPKITVSPTSGAAGDTITISGSGFAANSTVTFYLDSTVIDNASTNAYGTFGSTTLTVPGSSRGSHTIKAQDFSSNYATAPFTVAQKITISPASGVSGTTVTVNGNGFSASRPITIKYNAAAVTTTPASISTLVDGSFTATFAVPAGLAGTFPVEASDGTYTASANFTATIEVTASPVTSQASPGHVGTEITISGTGFKPSSQITITYTSEPVKFTTTSLADGSFSYTFTVPPSKAGAHTITATDGTNNLKATFFMESTAPAAPKPLLPAADGKAKSTAEFKWEGVTDDSLPVTYDLQIATDKAFTESAIILKEEGLTDSQYTLTKEEKLKSTKKDAPYYWRVRAVDAASNASAWTSPRAFSTGFTFELKGAGLYILIGVGALFFFLFGFFAGRGSRSSYGYRRR